MIQDVKIEGIKATPAIGGTAISLLTLNEVVAVVTIVYILLQAAYLVWKWKKEIKK